MEKIKTVKFIFKGYVQGVGFRSFCHFYALKFCISGSVQNMINGNVEIIASAQNQLLDLFFQKIKNGPPGSLVEEIQSEDITEPLLWKGFKIL